MATANEKVNNHHSNSLIASDACYGAPNSELEAPIPDTASLLKNLTDQTCNPLAAATSTFVTDDEGRRSM